MVKGMQRKIWYLLCEDNGHRIVQHTLPKQQCVQVGVHMEFMENGQYRHWEDTHNKNDKLAKIQPQSVSSLWLLVKSIY